MAPGSYYVRLFPNFHWRPNYAISEIAVVRQALLLLTMAVLTLSGCDKMKSVVDDVKSSTTTDAQPSAAATPPFQAAPSVPSTEPTAEQLLAEFRSLKLHEINDNALARVASRPEAASAITELELQGDLVTARGLESLAAMENLTSLAIRCPMMRPEGLFLLGRITSLKSLGIGSNQVNDDVVAALTPLSQLESLDLSGTSITPAAGAPLSRFTSLQTLNLGSTAVDDSTIAAIQSLPIKHLQLSRTRISDASLGFIQKIGSLESLEVAFCSVTGAGFKGYGSTDIKRLVVGETPFGIEGFVNIKGMKSLEELNVYKVGLVEHKSANVFRTFPKLKFLNAGGNSITNAGMGVFFKGHRTLEELHLMYNSGISDQGLAALIGVNTLKVLDVGNTGCTPNGAMALKQKLPECTIRVNDGTF
mgnify:CR=1 FL=1|jgi:hypothetical protein